MTEQIKSEPTAVSDQPAARSSERRRRSNWIFLRDVLLILLAALLISFVLKTFFIRSFYIPSQSMTNTLQVNDRVIVSLLTPGLTPLKHGDVVVFEDPGGWLCPGGCRPTPPQSPITAALAFVGLVPPSDNSHLIKRVIGLPGDTVKCCSTGGEVEVNGVLIDEPYLNIPKGVPNDKYSFEVTVPPGDLWVVGDHRYESGDSAEHNDQHDASPFVPMKDVVGRVMVISWPVDRWTFLSDYPNVFRNVGKQK
jgi:signal peptidase I